MFVDARIPAMKSPGYLPPLLRGFSCGETLGAKSAANPTPRGWFEYFKHAGKATFGSLDGWVRMRRRSIQRKQHGGIGRGRGADHQRWPKAFFEKLGLYSLAAAYAKECQPLKR